MMQTGDAGRIGGGVVDAERPIAYGPDLGVIRGRLRSLIIQILFLGGVTLLAIIGQNILSGRNLTKIRSFSVIATPTALWMLLIALRLFVRLRRDRPLITILPNGIRFDRWDFVSWRAIQEVEVSWTATDSKFVNTMLCLRIRICNLKSYSNDWAWVQKHFQSGRDWAKPLIFGQSDLGTPVPEIAAVIEAHRPVVTPCP